VAGKSDREESILRAVGSAAELFLAAVDRSAATDQVLAALGEATEAGRAHIYTVEPVEGDFLCSLVHEWVADGVRAVIGDPVEQGFRMGEGGYGRWVDVLGRGDLLQGLRSEFPESERGFLENEGILSVLVVPVFVEGRWWGWVGFDDTYLERRWSEAETDALRTAAGALGAAVQRERMERQRLNAEAKYRTLVEQLPSITYMASASADNATLYISPQVHAVLGYSPAEWLKTRGLWMKLLHPDDRDRAIAEANRHTETGEPLSTEYRMRSRWGKEIWIHEESVLVLDAQEKPLYWQGVMLDITGRKEAEEKAHEAEARYRALVEHMPAVVYVDEIGTGRTVYISPQIEEMLGYTPDEWTKEDSFHRKHVHQNDQDRYAVEDARAEATLEGFADQYRMVAKDGRAVWVDDHCVVVRDESGKGIYWHGVLFDISEQKRAGELESDLKVERGTSQQLRDLNEMKNTFLTALSHDFRTPLAAILGLAVTMTRAEIQLTPAESLDFSARIANQARKLDRLVTDLLDLERLSNGVQIKRTPTDIGSLARKVVDDAVFISTHEVVAEVGEVKADIDPVKVERILENLLANAVNHTPDGSRVWVRAFHQEGGVLLTVEDSGPGLSDELKAKVFEPFYRGHQGTSAPGVGVGLSLVKKFAELHGGRVWVTDREGGGASFHVSLPSSPS
jgi:PAS domain S-box-containing protein